MTVEINYPWSVVETECGEHVYVTDAHGNQVVRLPKKSNAIATFIAAAPDLLEALDGMIDLFDCYDNCSSLERTSKARNKARAVIDRAVGVTQ